MSRPSDLGRLSSHCCTSNSLDFKRSKAARRSPFACCEMKSIHAIESEQNNATKVAIALSAVINVERSSVDKSTCDHS
ncbi:hypothetical protein D3C72_2351450 [compost metagenome]